MKRTVALAFLLAVNLSGCAGPGINSALGKLRQHPAHCEAAIELLRQAIATGIVPADTSDAELDVLLHRTQIMLSAADFCPLAP